MHQKQQPPSVATSAPSGTWGIGAAFVSVVMGCSSGSQDASAGSASKKASMVLRRMIRPYTRFGEFPEKETHMPPAPRISSSGIGNKKLPEPLGFRESGSMNWIAVLFFHRELVNHDMIVGLARAENGGGE